MFENTLMSFFKSYTKQTEIEIRFHSRTMFNKGVTLDTFERVIAFLKANPNFQLKNKEEVTTVLQGKTNVRYVTNENDKTSYAMRKSKIKHVDIPNYNIRIAESKEVIFKMDELTYHFNHRPSLSREKRRLTFYHSSKYWKIDLTKVLSNGERGYELELEYITGNVKEAVQTGNDIIIQLLKVCQNSTYIISNDYAYGLLDAYKSLLKLHHHSFAGPLPFTISKKQFQEGIISCDYAVTDKADGTRVLLFINNIGECGYVGRGNLLLQLTFIGKINSLPRNTVVDCEMLNDSGKFYIFDVLVYNNIDVRHYDLKQRLNLIKVTEASSIKTTQIIQKKRFFFDNIFENAAKIWKSKKSFSYNLDGLIFTPINKPYFNTNIYKWKDDDTVDFYIEKIRQIGENTIWQLQLAAHDKDNVYRHFEISNKKEYFHKTGQKITKLRIKMPDKYSTTLVKTSKSDKFPNKSVIEMKFISDSWQPVKYREDKQFANGINAANDAWESISNPISINDISKGIQAFCGRRFHNYIKDTLIEKYMKNKNVLNIGSGAGGNIGKYKKHNVKQLVGVNIVNVEYNHNLSKMRFYKANNELYKIKNLIMKNKVTQFDVVNCQFAVHYFFKNDATLQNFIDNVKENLKLNGIVVITFMDSKLIMKLMNNKLEYKSSVVEIKINKISNRITGNEIEVDLKGTKYFKNKKSKEYLVDSQKLINVFKKSGFELLENLNFKSFYGKFTDKNLSEDDKAFSFLNNALIIKRIT
jgi:hypothetical protein